MTPSNLSKHRVCQAPMLFPLLLMAVLSGPVAAQTRRVSKARQEAATKKAEQGVFAAPVPITQYTGLSWTFASQAMYDKAKYLFDFPIISSDELKRTMVYAALVSNDCEFHWLTVSAGGSIIYKSPSVHLTANDPEGNLRLIRQVGVLEAARLVRY